METITQSEHTPIVKHHFHWPTFRSILGLNFLLLGILIFAYSISPMGFWALLREFPERTIGSLLGSFLICLFLGVCFAYQQGRPMYILTILDALWEIYISRKEELTAQEKQYIFSNDLYKRDFLLYILENKALPSQHRLAAMDALLVTRGAMQKNERQEWMHRYELAQTNGAT